MLETEWAGQEPSGAFFAGGGREHWKDTGIAIFSLIRHAELAQDWTFCRQMEPNIRKAVRFLMSLREKARAEGSANGRYGLLARGFCDGGIDGVRPELTNTLWVLAGLEALAGAAKSGRVSGFEGEVQFYRELKAAFRAAARQEMRKHPAGFEYLPMLLGEDPQWKETEAWALPRPQGAQWALSHAIYPGLVFAPDDAIVRGHLALMESCVKEQVPAETGWIAHGGLWNNQAAFQAQIYLWLRNP
ncbi:MAG: hypothetical protein NTY38_05475, partial [Acidobacteria bacterium]|nr:hypothetical protein [Acidobacteriota bacterium]